VRITPGRAPKGQSASMIATNEMFAGFDHR
jgi:hypothetical protein